MFSIKKNIIKIIEQVMEKIKLVLKTLRFQEMTTVFFKIASFGWNMKRFILHIFCVYILYIQNIFFFKKSLNTIDENIFLFQNLSIMNRYSAEFVYIIIGLCIVSIWTLFRPVKQKSTLKTLKKSNILIRIDKNFQKYVESNAISIDKKNNKSSELFIWLKEHWIILIIWYILSTNIIFLWSWQDIEWYYYFSYHFSWEDVIYPIFLLLVLLNAHFLIEDSENELLPLILQSFIVTSFIIVFESNLLIIIVSMVNLSLLTLWLMIKLDLHKNALMVSLFYFLSNALALIFFIIGCLFLIALTFLSIGSTSNFNFENFRELDLSEFFVNVLLLFILLGISVFLTLFPSAHMIPKIYQEVPNFTTAILLVPMKLIFLFFFYKLIFFFPVIHTSITIGVFGLLTMVIGTWFTLSQNRIKAFLSCTSMSQMGFFLLFTLGQDPKFITLGIIYCIIYLLIFEVLFLLIFTNKETMEILQDLSKLYKNKLSSQIFISAIWICLFLLTALPLTLMFSIKSGAIILLQKNFSTVSIFLWIPLILQSVGMVFFYLKLSYLLFFNVKPEISFSNKITKTPNSFDGNTNQIQTIIYKKIGYLIISAILFISFVYFIDLPSFLWEIGIERTKIWV